MNMQINFIEWGGGRRESARTEVFVPSLCWCGGTLLTHLMGKSAHVDGKHSRSLRPQAPCV